MQGVVRVCAIALAAGLLFPRDAFAYLDPGTGSLFFQTIAAVLAGVAYGVRVYWSRIRGWFRRDSSSVLASAKTPIDTPDRSDG